MGAEMAYRYALLKPLRAQGADAHNALLLGAATLGVEVTEPELAHRCGLGNIDPQHGRGDADPGRDGLTAIQAALAHSLPPDGSLLVTIRPDLDAFGAMALLTLRLEGAALSHDLLRRVADIAAQDRFDNGPWPGARALPTSLGEYVEAVGGSSELAPLHAAMADHKLQPAERVAIARSFLDRGDVPAPYRAQVEERASTLMQAVDRGAVRLTVELEGRIAFVEGSHDAALRLGYRLAPVVVALNPEHRLPGGPPHRKSTIAQYSRGFADLLKVAEDLSAIEPGWGGSASIVGSPQGAGSALSSEQVIGTVAARCHFAYLFQAKGIQKFIMAGGRLIDIAGASELLAAAVRSDKEDLLEAVLQACRWSTAENGFSRRAGAVFMLHFTGDKIPEFRRFEALWRIAFAQWVPGLEFTTSLGTGESERSAFDDAYRKAAALRENGVSDLLPLAGPLAARAQRTGLPATSRADEDEVIDLPTTRKRPAGKTATHADRFLPPELRGAGYVWPTNMGPTGSTGKRKTDADFPFEGDDQRVGVIHADLSGLGQTYARFGDTIGGDVAQYLDLARRIEDAVAGAAQAATKKHLVPEANEDGRKRLPGRPILLGGDDLTIIVRADLALDYAETLLEAIEKRTKEALSGFPQLDERLLTACAGVAFASASQPFYLMTDLAEGLCAYAKRVVKAGPEKDATVPSAIAFHRVTASVVDDYQDILTDEETDLEGRRLTAQPYLVGGCSKQGLPTLASLRTLREVLEREGLGTTNLRELRQLTLRSPGLARAAWDNWRRTAKRRAKSDYQGFVESLAALGVKVEIRDGALDCPSLPFAERAGTKVTPLFDALEWRTLAGGGE
jgi:hypothetical protein